MFAFLISFIIERFGLVSWLRPTSFQFLATVTKARRARLMFRQVLRVTEYYIRGAIHSTKIS